MWFVAIVAIVSVALIFSTAHAINTPYERAVELLAQMTLEEKLAMLHGHPGIYVGNVVGNRRLNIPSLNMQDGPQGFRVNGRTGDVGSTTAWPSALSIAASFDEDLVHRWSVAMAKEFKGKGANIALAPGIGMARVANAGRNFEYLCGEDPILGAKLVKEVVHGIQGEGIIANAKHWVNNEIEESRKQVSANVDERTRFELYYPPFQAAVSAGVLSVMCAYNRINDVYACENPDTIGHLKNTMGFNGWVISDWTATHSTAPALKSGMDMEMPFGLWYNERMIEAALTNNTISEDDVNNAVVRTLTSMFAIGLFDRRPDVNQFATEDHQDVIVELAEEEPNLSRGNPKKNVTCVEHNTLAREIAAKSTVLLKNDNTLLPLTADTVGANGCIAVVGDQSIISGGGSGHVTPYYTITQSQGIQNYLDANADVFGGAKVVYDSGANSTFAAELASSCNVAIVVVATTSSEGSDRKTLSLGSAQDSLVSAVAKANKNTVVSVITPGASLLPWADEVPAILMSWLPGQEAGSGLADVLFGAVNPYARLPVTIPNKDNEVEFTTAEYPGVGHPPQAEYHEQLLIGYRWYEAKAVQPHFSFGHGLSYTAFSYSSTLNTLVDDLFIAQSRKLSALEVMKASTASQINSAVDVSFTVTNVGKVDGSEIAQLYLAFPAEANEPVKQLKNFLKVDLSPSETKVVTLSLTLRDLSIWDENAHNWNILKGQYGLFVGASSSDIRVTGSFQV